MVVGGWSTCRSLTPGLVLLAIAVLHDGCLWLEESSLLPNPFPSAEKTDLFINILHGFQKWCRLAGLIFPNRIMIKSGQNKKSNSLEDSGERPQQSGRKICSWELNCKERNLQICGFCLMALSNLGGARGAESSSLTGLRCQRIELGAGSVARRLRKVLENWEPQRGWIPK